MTPHEVCVRPAHYPHKCDPTLHTPPFTDDAADGSASDVRRGERARGDGTAPHRLRERDLHGQLGYAVGVRCPYLVSRLEQFGVHPPPTAHNSNLPRCHPCCYTCAQVAPWAGHASITTGLPFTEGEGYSKGDTPGMGRALELGSTQVRVAKGCVPFVFTTRIPSAGTEALATLQPALNQTVTAIAASGCWMSAGAGVVAQCLGRQLPSWAQEHRERFEEDALEALSQDLTPTLRAATVASCQDALRERLAKQSSTPHSRAERR